MKIMYPLHGCCRVFKPGAPFVTTNGTPGLKTQHCTFILQNKMTSLYKIQYIYCIML